MGIIDSFKTVEKMSVLTSLVLKLGAFNKLNASTFIFSYLFWELAVSISNNTEVFLLLLGSKCLLIPASMQNPLYAQLAKPTWRISPYPHQDSDHHHHTCRKERTQHVTRVTNM